MMNGSDFESRLLDESDIFGTSPPDPTMELYIIKDRLRVCSISKHTIGVFAHTLIKVALLQESRPEFFSFTETKDDYTVILSEDQFQELRQYGNFEFSQYPWRVFTVSAGAFGTSKLVGVSKIAKSVIAPLADHEISVLCLSTYQSDFILVQEPFLDEAMQCLGSFFKIYNEDHHKIDDPHRPSQLPVELCENRVITHPLICPSNKFYITGLHLSQLSAVLQVLLDLMFYPSQPAADSGMEPFFHFSIIQGDVSLILDEEAIAKFPANSLYTTNYAETWRMIKIGDTPLGFEECGIVAQVAGPLSSAGISTYYVSTYLNDQSLVLDADIDHVLKVLRSKLAIEELDKSNHNAA